MSNPSPPPPEAQTPAGGVDAQKTAEYLEKQLEYIDLNDPQSGTESQEPRRKKIFARDLLKKLEGRRLEIARINFTTDGSQAGRGSHGEVVVATLVLGDVSSSELGKQVAVKKLIVSENVDEEKFLRIFANELHILNGLNHPSIIELVGFVENIQKGMAWLVFPWEANGNVREFLLSGKWELPERASLIKDVASGLEYLHTRKPPIRHGDLKSLNVLVNSSHRAVITDFGSARTQREPRESGTTSGSPHRQAASNNSRLTVDDGGGCPEVTVSLSNAELTLTGPSWSFRWAAPEILNEEEPCLASDVWALGWIAWEIVTDNYPFPEVKTSKLITVKVIKGLLPSLYDDGQLSQIGRLCDVMVKCWKPETTQRLSAAECRTALQWVPSTIPRVRNDGTPHIRSAALLLEMGQMRRSQSNYKEASELFEEALAIARSAGDKRTMARALYMNAGSQRMMYNYDRAEEDCNHALTIYASIEDVLGRAGALFRLGEIHQSRGNVSKAQESYTQAMAAYTSIGYKLGRANTLYRLGGIHSGRVNYTQAEESFNQALAIFTEIGDTLGRGNVFQGLGEIYQVQSNHAKAEEYFNQALAIFTGIGNGLGQANALVGLGGTQEAQSNYLGAEESFSHALAIYTRIGRRVGRITSLLGLGEILLRQARYSEAKSFLDDAAQVSNQFNYEWAQPRLKRLLGEVLAAEKSPAEAPN